MLPKRLITVLVEKKFKTQLLSVGHIKLSKNKQEHDSNNNYDIKSIITD